MVTRYIKYNKKCYSVSDTVYEGGVDPNNVISSGLTYDSCPECCPNCTCCENGWDGWGDEPLVRPVRCCFDDKVSPRFYGGYYFEGEVLREESESDSPGSCAGTCLGTSWSIYELVPAGEFVTGGCKGLFNIDTINVWFEDFSGNCSLALPAVPSRPPDYITSGAIMYSAGPGQEPNNNIANWRFNFWGGLRWNETYVTCCSGSGKSQIRIETLPMFCMTKQYTLELYWDDNSIECGDPNMDYECL